MTIDTKDVVARLHTALIDQIGAGRWELWFGKLSQLECDGERLRVVASSPFVGDWIRSEYGAKLRLCLESIAGSSLELKYELAAQNTNRASAAKAELTTKSHAMTLQNEGSVVTAESSAVSDKAVADVAAPPVAILPLAKTLSVHSAETRADKPAPPTPPSHRRQRPRRRYATLTSFVAGEENQTALTAARLAVDQPGMTSPLLLHGPTATGKTHLLEGIRTAVCSERASASVLLLPAEQFTTDFVQSAHRREMPSFRAKYRFVDYLLVDDVHFLIGKKKTVDELLYTVDALAKTGRQVVLTADRPTGGLCELGEEFISRIAAGLAAPLTHGGFDIRLGIARRAAMALDWKLSDDVLAAVATLITSNARAVQGAVNHLYAHWRSQGDREMPVSREFAERVLTDLAKYDAPTVRLEDVERAVCNVFGIDSKNLRSQKRNRAASDPRTLAMWLARKYTRAALSEIGTHFGRRSHSTVITASQRVEKWLANHTPIVVGNTTCNPDQAIRNVEAALRRA